MLAEAYLMMMIPILGLFIGSFANVLIYRIPRHEEWVRTPSHCPVCNTKIKWYDLIPVVSWILLRGKCRSCKTVISPLYPLIELANGVLWLICILVFGLSAFLPIALTLSTVLLVVSVIDWQTQEIPDGLMLFLLIIGLIWNGYAIWAGYSIWLENLIGFLCVSVPLLLIAMLTKGGMGGGDIKLTAVCGMILGWPNMLLSLAFASIVGTLIMLPVHIIQKKERTSTVPFGPFLAVGILIALFWGDVLIQWYLTSVGIAP